MIASNPSHQSQDDEHDKDDTNQAYTAMPIAIPVAAKTAAEAPEQENDENNN
jgi:hypothetical protein